MKKIRSSKLIEKTFGQTDLDLQRANQQHRASIHESDDTHLPPLLRSHGTNAQGVDQNNLSPSSRHKPDQSSESRQGQIDFLERETSIPHAYFDQTVSPSKTSESLPRSTRPIGSTCEGPCPSYRGVRLLCFRAKATGSIRFAIREALGDGCRSILHFFLPKSFLPSLQRECPNVNISSKLY